MSDPYAALVVGAGTAANMLIAGMFVARVHAPRRSRALGFAGTAMAIPLAVASAVAISSDRGGWFVTLPLGFVVFAIVEVIVDLLLDVDVRTTGWLWPYLAVFYLAQWAVIGAAFLVGTGGGFAVLATYFVCLTATAYSYRRVGHGAAQDRV